MSPQRVRLLGAVLVLGISAATYIATLQPSVPFWDCGEFSAAIALQQVPHPPGAPLFLMVGKLFHLLPFGDPGWRMNLISALASSAASVFLYLLLALVLERLWKVPTGSWVDALHVYGASAIGALAMTYSDTVWFNAVESEVYASSLLFVAAVLYLGFLWYVRADEAGSERYLLLAAYLVGLSIGVHLLSILAVPGILYLVVFRKYGANPAEATFRNTRYLLLWFAIPLVGFAIVYWGITQWLPALLAGDLPFRTEAREHVIEDSPVVALVTLVLLGFLGWQLYRAYREQRAATALALSSFFAVVLGFTTYAHVLIRANSHPPMNENEPTTLARLISYLGREQYGEAPWWPRRYRYDDPYYSQHYSKYGAWYPPRIERVQRRDGSTVPVPRWTRVNVAGELRYLWEYQISHMYLRYFLWNYVGRMSDVQDAPAAGPLATKRDALPYNYDSGYADAFPVRFFGLPLLLGLLGMGFHFSRDRRTAWVMLVTFLLMGVLAAIAQNQQLPQPRERDYFYVGSFLVFCFWIGLGAYAVTEWLRERLQRLPALAVSTGITLSALAAPVNMALGGWRIHDRSGNYLPFDHSYNILQSCERDAILFTNGDNDTFPLWYLQDVAGVRRDVRVVNLSLGNTLWYIRQLKHEEPHGAKPIPLSFPDEALESEDSPRALQPEVGPAREVTIPVRRAILERFTQDTALLRDGTMRFTFVGMPWRQEQGRMLYLFRVQDKLILDILQQTRFERPVYFSITVGSDAYAGLDRHLRLEGMVYRVCPVPQNSGQQMEAIEPQVMEACLLTVDNSNAYHTEPHYGFKFRNLHNRRVYYDEVHRRLILNYRTLYVRYAVHLLEQRGDSAKAVAVLDAMDRFISSEQFPLSYWFAYNLAQLYQRAGASEKARRFAAVAAKAAELVARTPEIAQRETAVQYYNPRWIAAEAYQLAGEYDQARLMLQELLTEYPNEPTLQARLGELEITRLEAQGKYREALDTAEALLTQYAGSSSETLRSMVPQLREHITRLRRQLGLPDTTVAR